MLTSRAWRPLREAERRISYVRTFLSRDDVQYFATRSTLDSLNNSLNPVKPTLDLPKDTLNTSQLRHYSTLKRSPNLITNQMLLPKIESRHYTTNFWSLWSRRFPFEFHSGSTRYLTSKCSDGNQTPPEKSDKEHSALKTVMDMCKESGAESKRKDKPEQKHVKVEESGTSAATPCGKTQSTRTSTASSSGGEHSIKLGESRERQTLQNFHTDCNVKINSQINSELTSAYVYLSMASFLRQDNVALLGFAKYFSQASIEETEHAEKLIQYLNIRGGQLQLTPIAAPVKHEWESIEQLLAEALSIEKHLNEDLLKLHDCASSHGDAHLSDFIDAEYLPEQVKAIKQLADLITIVKRMGRCCLYIVDRDMMNGVYSNHGK